LRSKLAVPIAGLIATGVPLAIGVSNILNHFYRQGAYILDSGLLAYLMTAAGPSLPLPRALGGGSFYALHVAPLFVLLQAIAHLLPLGPPQFFALFIGVGQALLAGGVFWALVGPIGLTRGGGIVLAVLLAIVFANSGLAIAILRYPHFEIIIAASAILLLDALAYQRLGLGAFFLILALLTREDAGFHIGLLLAAIITARRAIGLDRKAERPMLVFAALALLYSVAAFSAQHWAFPGSSSFARIYAGSPPYAHVTFGMIAERLLGWTVFRTYVVLPAAIALGWAILRRNPLLFAGYASTLPWLAFHLLAISLLAGTLSSYYAFPLLVAGFWPLIGCLKGERVASPAQRREAVIGFIVLMAASFTALPAQHNPNNISLADTFAPPPSPHLMRAVTTAVATLVRNKDALGHVLVDSGVASLAPDDFDRPEVFWIEARSPPDTIVYFAEGFEAVPAQARAARAGLLHAYSIDGTPIRIASDRAIEQIPDLALLVRQIR
jgi:hypothetical protein